MTQNINFWNFFLRKYEIGQQIPSYYNLPQVNNTLLSHYYEGTSLFVDPFS